MALKKEDRRQYWQQRLEHFISSGLSQKQYVKQHKVSLGSLHKWSKILSIPLNPSMNESCKKEPELLSFIELQNSSLPVQIPLKLEIVGAGGLIVKTELTTGWEQVVGLLKALAN